MAHATPAIVANKSQRCSRKSKDITVNIDRRTALGTFEVVSGCVTSLFLAGFLAKKGARKWQRDLHPAG